MKKIIVIVLVVLAGGYLVMKNNETSEVKDQDVKDNEEVARPEDTGNDEDDVTEDSDDETDSDETDEGSSVEVEGEMDAETQSSTDYQNGTYSSDVSYNLPNGGSHDMTVNVTLTGDIVTNLDLVFEGEGGSASNQNQVRFQNAIKPFVISKDVDTVTSLSRVGGASLTTAAFNEAMAEIRADAS